jgi:hypothetical protein
MRQKKVSFSLSAISRSRLAYSSNYIWINYRFLSIYHLSISENNFLSILIIGIEGSVVYMVSNLGLVVRVVGIIGMICLLFSYAAVACSDPGIY